MLNEGAQRQQQSSSFFTTQGAINKLNHLIILEIFLLFELGWQYFLLFRFSVCLDKAI